ncbi:MAG: NAD-binding protein [Solirubrobacterales bacterium]
MDPIGSQVPPPSTPETDVSDWEGHVIVCGLHDVALRTVEQLHLAGIDVVVIDEEPEPRLVSVIKSWNIPYIARSTTLDDPFDSAGLQGAAAIVCAESSDLITLATALQVRNLRPDVRIVVHLDNPAVGNAIEGITGTGSVLDVAGLFAPSVVDASLGRTAHDLELGGQEFVAADIKAPRSGTLREIYGDLAPIGVITGPNETLIPCPSRDQKVEEGDQVTVLGTPADLIAAGIEPDDRDRDYGPPRRNIFHRAGLAFREAGDYIDGPIRATLWAGLMIVVISTLVLRAFYDVDGTGMSWIEALYFTIETSATVGFGDFSFAAEDPPLQIFAIWLIVAGTAFVSLLFAFITNALVSRRIEASLGRAKVRGTEGHVILIGLGSVGMRVLEGLRDKGVEVVVIERDEDNRYSSQVRLMGVRVILGDATLKRTLDAANLETASAVAVMTSDDMTNIESGLAVRQGLGTRWQQIPVILRVFDRTLGYRLEDNFEFRHVWSTAAIAAPWFVGGAIGMGVLATFYVGNEPFQVAKLTVREGGGLVGVKMIELGANARVIAINRSDEDEDLEYPPRRDTEFAAGDRAYIAGPYEELMKIVGMDHAAATG